ncbi:hypothetical protein L210DRAFT_3647870 [Boletus edulis BED1]|uniref:Uncharacterized protein n=1 Tax=Boletus edulis BED1 TaxID=1328754 RepID=A0AAD4GCQ0_BOLED|nr:hypothetical protein L210DRAFT_3647870 [Boletus edulis BED1]
MALKSVGLSKRHVAQTCQLVAAILGSIEFTIDCGRDMDAAVVRNGDVLGIVAGFLGAWPSALEATLAYKTKLVKRELVLFFYFDNTECVRLLQNKPGGLLLYT